MAAEYDDFEGRLRARLATIGEEIAEAQEQGRAALANPSDRVGRALAAQQIKIKQAERSRVAAMLAGVQQQQSELQMANFTSDYVKLMQSSSKMGPNLSEKQVEGVVRAYESRLDGTHAVGSLLNDSAEDTFETTMDNSVSFLSTGGDDDGSQYAELFGLAPAAPAAAAPAPAPATAPAPAPGPAPAAVNLPSVPSATPGAARGHRRSNSISREEAASVDWLLADGSGSGH